MPALSWNEIKSRAIKFSRDWSEETQENAEAQTFWNELFDVFGMKRRQVASFEERVKSLKGKHRIDLFWKGKLLAEHKSRGEDMSKATSQAFNYIQELINEGRADECPRYVAVSDFKSILLYDLEPDNQLELAKFQAQEPDIIEIPVKDFYKYTKHFAFIAGLKTQKLREQDTANMKAATIMARLHDTLAVGGYAQPDLERLLVRLLFCLFADDTSIFNPDTFDLYIENRTREDGSDLGMHLQQLFEVLDTPQNERTHIHDEELLEFPYVNGELFTEKLHFAYFNKDMRNALLAACRFDWSRISPAIFGSLFQGVMDAKERRQIGAHYTSERDILKLIQPLFLDELHEEFEQIRKDRSSRRKGRLTEFQNKIASLKFLDPACGCGNFLVIAYRELRTLELEILKLLYGTGESEFLTQTETDIQHLSKVDVDQFYGIEIDMWASRIAETALWLTDHQANMRLSEAFGQIFLRIPLKKSPHILHANALRTDWNDHLPAKECSYILGNPPFVGKHLMNTEQKEDMQTIWQGIKGSGSLDYVTCWYHKASEYIDLNTNIPCAFVSTNSITQGEQVAYLWNYLFQKKCKIIFGHRTFQWQSEAQGKAHVHVVIIGFARFNPEKKLIFEYEKGNESAHVTAVENISPYLIEGADIVVMPLSKPISNVPSTIYGNKPADNGCLILDNSKYQEIKRQHPEILHLIKPLLSAEEYLHGKQRWCLWLENALPSELKKSAFIMERIEGVKSFREASSKKQTRELALIPSLFAERRQPTSEYVIIPQHTSENRFYIPFGYFQPDTIVHNSCTAVPNATPYHFGVISSSMHMAWVRQVCGRLKSDYRYSAKLVYNNFPWAEKPSKAQVKAVEAAAQGILDVRQKYLDAGSTLADLYDPITMPADLLKAHHENDRAVDRCYRRAAFKTERERIEFLFCEYERLTTPLTATPKKSSRKRARKAS